MEARELAETAKELIHDAAMERITRWGYGDADFFVETDGEGTFLVSVVKVSE